MSNTMTNNLNVENILEFKINNNIQLFSKNLSVLEKISPECYMSFKPDVQNDNKKGNNITIYFMTPDYNIFFKYIINTNDLEYYKCNTKLIIKINLQSICRSIETDDNNSAFYIEKNDPHYLHIKTNNNSSKIKISLVNEQKFVIPPTKFEKMIRMSSKQYQDICLFINRMENIKIKYENLSFIDPTNVTEYIVESDHRDKDETEHVIKCKSHNLLIFEKCEEICENIELYFGMDLPITIKISTKIGDIYTFIVPINSKKYQIN